MPNHIDFLHAIKHSLRLLCAGLVMIILLLFLLTLNLLFPNKIKSEEITKNQLENENENVTTLEESSILADDPNIEIIKTNCTACHSARLIVQYRASRQGWKNMIVWMQQNQKLWDLGTNEALILDYLEKYYGEATTNSRRQNLSQIDWYLLTD